MGYDQEYFNNIHTTNRTYHIEVANAVYKVFTPKSIIDIGAGTGEIANRLRELGVNNITLYDYSTAAIEMCRRRGFDKIYYLDLCKEKIIKNHADVCMCFEVLEHIPFIYADNCCKLLSQISPVLIVSAATPGQGGHLHVNEDLKENWISRFESSGLKYSQELTDRVRSEYSFEMIKDYNENLMVYTKKPIL